MNDNTVGGTTLAVICWIVPLQITGAAGVNVIIGVCFINAVTFELTEQPIASVDVRVNV